MTDSETFYFLLGCLAGNLWGYFVQPWWNKQVDKLFERWWP